jgi:DivIVA domain-containing protein
MDDDRIVISSGVALTPESVANHSFGSSFRGYDPSEVRTFLKRVGEELAGVAAREIDLRQSLQEALSRAAHPDLDEDILTSALGEHAARLLTNAREAATNIVAEAETRAARIIGEAEGRIARVRAEADSLLARRSEEADRMTAGLRQSAEADARALRERARAEAEAEVEAARAQGREMVGEARSVRERMLSDLTRRRRTAEVQIEQLRLARQRLVEAYGVVRRTLDEVTGELGAAEAEIGPLVDAVGASRPRPALVSVPEDHPAGNGADTAGPRPPSGSNGGLSVVGPRTGTNGGGRRPGLAGPPPAAHTRAVDDAGTAAAPAASAGTDAASAAPAAPPVTAGVEVESAGPKRTPEPDVDRPWAAGPSENGHATIVATTVSSLHPAADPELDPAPVPTGDPGGSRPVPSSVEELFARMRAAQAPLIPSDPVVAPAGSPDAVDGSDGEGDADPVASSAEGLDDDAGTGADVLGGGSPAGDGGQPAVASESALSRRDAAVESLEGDLIRQLKRVLQDEQNQVLDVLRRQRRPTPGAVLPAADDQTARVRAAALPMLRRAGERGAALVSGSGAKVVPARTGQAERWAAELATDLVAPLRERLERAFAETDDGDDSGGAAARNAPVADSLGAAYRQWKTTQVERVARHHVVAAFSRGAYGAVPDGASQSWIVDDDGPCPDCDDNALAGPVTKGTPFPTGQLHPPAHPGCRCLLVPDRH